MFEFASRLRSRKTISSPIFAVKRRSVDNAVLFARDFFMRQKRPDAQAFLPLDFFMPKKRRDGHGFFRLDNLTTGLLFRSLCRLRPPPHFSASVHSKST